MTDLRRRQNRTDPVLHQPDNLTCYLHGLIEGSAYGERSWFFNHFKAALTHFQEMAGCLQREDQRRPQRGARRQYREDSHKIMAG